MEMRGRLRFEYLFDEFRHFAALWRICLKRGFSPNDVAAIETRFTDKLRAKVNGQKSLDAVKVTLQDELFPLDSKPEN
eukprot:1464336-Amphidinium_carterae.1